MAAPGTRDLLQLLANPTNRSILSVLSLEAQYPRRLAEIVGLTEDEASKRLRLFEKAGLAEGTWANVGKNVRLYKLATRQFTVQVDAQGLSIKGVKSGSKLNVGSAAELPPATDKFQGRETELADLKELLVERPAVCVQGIGGVGKTALAARLSQRLSRPVVWHTLASSESASLLLGRMAAAQRLHETTDAAQRLLDLRSPDEEATLRQAFLDSVNATRSLLVLDRFEAAAEGTVDEIAHWVRGLKEGRLVITSRTFPSSLPRDKVASFRLAGLSRTDTDATITAYGGRTRPEVLNDIYDRTRGHALSLVLIAQLAEESREAHVERLLEESGIRDFVVDDVLPQLPENERDLLFSLSVLRLPFTAEEAEGVSENKFARHTLLKLEGRGLISRAGDTFLLHDLLRSFIAAAAPRPKALHAKAAKVLEGSGEPVKVLEAIHHHLESDVIKNAADIIRAEATRRTYRFVDLGLAERYRSILERVAERPTVDPAGRAASLLELGILDTFDGEAARAAKRFGIVETLLGGATAGEMLFPLLIARARLFRLNGKLDEAVQALIDADALAQNAKDDRRSLEAVVERAFIEEERDDAVSFQLFKRAIELGTKTSDVLLLSLAYSGAARISMRGGDDRHRDWAEEALRLSRLAGYLRGEVAVYMTLTTFAMVKGEMKSGLEFSTRYLDIANQLGDPWLKACAMSDKAMLLIATRMYEDATRIGEETLALARSIRSPFYEFTAGIVLAEAHFGLGHHAKAQRVLDAALKLDVNAWPAMASRGWRIHAANLRSLGQSFRATEAERQAQRLEQRSWDTDLSRDWSKLPRNFAPEVGKAKAKPGIRKPRKKAGR